MGFDYLDLVYSWSAPDGPAVEEIVDAVGGLIASGKVRAWGTGNWEPDDHASAARIAEQAGVPPPCAAQLPYSVIAREHAEGPAMEEALDVSRASVVASFVLGGGALTGKYADRSSSGRLSATVDDARLQRGFRAADALRTLAAELDTTAPALALAFALANERVATALFGATSHEQIAENARAVEVFERLTPAQLGALRAIGSE
jgi:aryl-alcohol dehydrogenase-like predicted oxidoreductase